jgi:hypothetical protein
MIEEPERAPGRATWVVPLAHVLVVGWLFAGSWLRGELPYFRDVSSYYYPNYVFLERSFDQGVWPLWNPTNDCGAPFLIAYPLELLLVLVAGARGALLLAPPIHVLIALCGGSVLARRLGCGPWGSWAGGVLYGASGYLLSSLNLFELSHGTALTPWVVAAFLGLLQEPTLRRAASLGALAALQASTLAAEALLQTALAGLCLLPRVPTRRDLGRLATAGLIAALLAAPVLLGTRAMVEGTRRFAGLPREEAFAWSATPITLLEAVVPQLFGDVHTFTNWGFSGQPFFSGGFPYLLSLYLGPIPLLLAACAGRGQARLWLLVALGILSSLGDHGPLEVALSPLLKHFRTPVKFFLLTTLGLSLLASRGLDRLTRRRPSRAALLLVPGALLLAAGLALARWPEPLARLAGSWVPELRNPYSRFVAAGIWPAAWTTTGALALGAGLSMCAGSRLAAAAGLLAALDLLVVNTRINPSAPAGFYEPGPQLKSLLRAAETEGPYRWFSYGVANSPGVAWSLLFAHTNSDRWLYYMDRQSLLPRTHVLDGLEAAFDEELGLFAPLGSTLHRGERRPDRFRDHHARLRGANVRWVLSFHELPADLVELRAQAVFSEIRQPLRLYELRDPLPRAFWVGADQVVVEGGGGRVTLRVGSPTPGADLRFERPDPHTVLLHASTPPGYLVVLEGYHEDWQAAAGSGPVPLLRADGRYWVLPTAGGRQTFTVRYRPRWRGPALLLLAAGGLLCLVLWFRPRRSPPGGPPHSSRSPSRAISAA